VPTINDLCPVCGGALASAGQHDAGPFCGCTIQARKVEQEKRRAAVREDVARASGGALEHGSPQRSSTLSIVTTTTITIRSREYTVETLPPDTFDPTRPSYRITGVRGAKYRTMRNRPHPELMFLIREDTSSQGALKDVWLTDKDGTLREVRR
jgi:hypothetical protein